jgi:hypothetical protein
MVAPMIYWGATTYGVESLEWDPEFASYNYVERPGGMVVAVVGLTVAALLVVFALYAIATAVSIAARRRGRRVPQPAPQIVSPTPAHQVEIALSGHRSYP